ncbi:MAG: Gfo/Idh/MocA family oxidoreductase [Gammaproteobacteria bacterium]|nr:Gfo/Idh/MocA family oxidoreductase [Gammaproteobacteria bacterium]
MVKIGVIGYGYWGPNLVRNFVEVPGSQVVAVSDLRQDSLDRVKARYPTITVTTKHHDLLVDPTIDAIVIATPVSTHFDLAMQALQAGKHVLIEKPMAATVEQGERLIEMAARFKRVLMVDHTFVYTGAVRKIKELVDAGNLGRIFYYDSVRVNLGLFQHDVNVLWDLAIHDLAIMDFVLGARPCAVSATGIAHVPGKPEDMAYLSCFFNENLIAHFHVNWLAPVKIRSTLLGGDQQMIVYDDLEPSEKLKIYDKGITLTDGPEGRYQQLVGYRTGDMWAPKLNTAEALHVETLHFLECIEQGQEPLSDGQAGLRTVRILEAATQSLTQRGRPVELVWDEGH